MYPKFTHAVEPYLATSSRRVTIPGICESINTTRTVGDI